MPCPPTHFPRSGVDAKEFGEAVREARKPKKWSQSALARRVGVTRHTIARLEAGTTTPGIQVVRALKHPTVLGSLPGVDWEVPGPDNLSDGFLAHLARRASGQTLEDVAKTVGCSIATISDFERNVLYNPGKLGVSGNAVGEPYAKALGFRDAADMVEYLNARDAYPWLERIAEKFGQAPLLDALRPSVRPADPVPEIDLRG